MKHALSRYAKGLMEKREQETSQSKIQTHASNLSARNSVDGFAQNESAEQTSQRLSIQSLQASKTRLIQLRGHKQALASPVSQISSRSKVYQPQFKWQTDTLCVKQNQISGWLRKTVQQIKLFQKSQFPLRFYVVNLNSKNIYIFDKPGGKLKQDLSLHGMRCAVQLNVPQQDSTLSPKTRKEFQSLPKDFTEPFAIFLKDQVMLLWAKNVDEQTMWRRELKQLQDPADAVNIDSARFVQDFEQNMTYSYQLFQQLQRHRHVVQETPRKQQQPTHSQHLQQSILASTDNNQTSVQQNTNENVPSASATMDTSWINNFYLIFSTTVQQQDFQKAEERDDSESIPSKFKNAEKQSMDNDMTNISQTMRSIIDEVLFRSSTCFQMEYVIMGYLKVPMKSDEQTTAAGEEQQQHLQIRLKGSLAASAESDGKQNQSLQTYFCAINFNLRKFAMIKMEQRIVQDENDNQDVAVDHIAQIEYEATSELEQFAFTDLETVTSVAKTHQRKRTTSSDTPNIGGSKGSNNVRLINYAAKRNQMQPVSSAATAQNWQCELLLKTKQRNISLLISSKKEKQLWLTEFSRAIEWADGASPAKAFKSRPAKRQNVTTEQQSPNQQTKPTKNQVLLQEIASMEPASVDGLSMPPYQFFCYKNFMTGMVRVKVSNFESILKTKHNYPIQKLKLVLKQQGSSLYLDGDKNTKSGKTQLGLFTLEKASLENQTVNEDQKRQNQMNSKPNQESGQKDKRKSSFGRLLNRMIGSKSSPRHAKQPLYDEDEISNQFAFSLKTEAKTYTFFTSSIEEAETWVRVLSLICEMNRRNISIDAVNPFDYEKYKGKKAEALRLELEEASVELPTKRVPNPLASQEHLKESEVDTGNSKRESRRTSIAQALAEEVKGNKHAGGGQIKLLGIESQSPPKTMPQDHGNTADSILNQGAAQQQEELGSMQVQQLASAEGQSFNSGGAGGAGGLALKLENCKVGQIVIQVNDQSQLASMMGLKLTQEQNNQSQTGVSKSQEPIIQTNVEHSRNATTNLMSREVIASQAAEDQHMKSFDQRVLPPPQNLPDKMQPSTHTEEQKQERFQSSISEAKPPHVDLQIPMVDQSQQQRPQQTENLNSRNIVRNFRKNQLNSAMRKEKRIKLNNQKQDQMDQLNIRENDASFQYAVERPPSHLVKSTMNQEAGAELSEDQSSSMQRQTEKRPHSSLMLKGTGKRIFTKKSDNLAVNKLQLQSPMAAIQAITQQPEALSTQTYQQHMTRTAGCLIIPKRNVQKGSSKIELGNLKRDAQSTGQQKIQMFAERLDHPDITSEDILRQSGCSERLKQEVKELNSGLPIFFKRQQVFNPGSTTSASQKNIVLQATENYSFNQLAAQQKDQIMSVPRTPLRDAPKLQSKQVAQVTAQSNSPIQSSSQKKKLMNFEQMIENQRDLNFLDKLIAQGDRLYGVTSSTLINQQFNLSNQNLEPGPHYSATNGRESRNKTKQLSQSTNLYSNSHQHFSLQNNNNSLAAPLKDVGVVVQSCEISDWDEDSDSSGIDRAEESKSNNGKQATDLRQYSQNVPPPARQQRVEVQATKIVATDSSYQEKSLVPGQQKRAAPRTGGAFTEPNEHSHYFPDKSDQIALQSNSQLMPGSRKMKDRYNLHPQHYHAKGNDQYQSSFSKQQKPSIVVEDFESTWD